MQHPYLTQLSSLLIRRRQSGAIFTVMDTVQDIRRANLRALLAELEEQKGTSWGVQAELSRRTGVPGPQISQFLNGRFHQGGKERGLGDDAARKLERGMNKPKGWMDIVHTHVSDKEQAILSVFAQLTDAQRELLEQQAREMARLNAAMRGDPLTLDDKTPLRH